MANQEDGDRGLSIIGFSGFLGTAALVVIISLVPLSSASGSLGSGQSPTVNPLDPASLMDLTIHYEHEPTVLCDGGSTKFTATASWDNGATTVVDATWSVSPTAYASIDASTGVLTTYRVQGVSQGVTVQASYPSDNVARTATRTVSITDCHVDGPPYPPFFDSVFGCAVVGHAGRTTPVDPAGAYPILIPILILGLLKVGRSWGRGTAAVRRKRSSYRIPGSPQDIES